MNIEYNKENREIEITGVADYLLANPTIDKLELYIEGTLITELTADYNYPTTSDGIRLVEIKSTIDLVVAVVMFDTVLTIEYSKDRNRALLVSILDNGIFKGVETIYVNNRKIIREIENSFASSIPERSRYLISKLKW